MADKIEIRYQIEELDDVLKFFANNYQPKQSDEIVRFEYFLDAQQKKVVFKIYYKKHV